MKYLFHFLPFVLLCLPSNTWTGQSTKMVEKQGQRFLADLENELPNKNNLLTIISSRLKNVGLPFLTRDVTKAVLISRPAVRIESWLATMMGIMALATERIARNLGPMLPPGYPVEPIAFLNATSLLLGAGVGVVALSNDMDDYVRSVQCLEGRKMAADGIPCGRSRFLVYILNLIAFGANVLGLFFPTIGPIGALLQALKTILLFLNTNAQTRIFWFEQDQQAVANNIVIDPGV